MSGPVPFDGDGSLERWNVRLTYNHNATCLRTPFYTLELGGVLARAAEEMFNVAEMKSFCTVGTMPCA